MRDNDPVVQTAESLRRIADNDKKIAMVNCECRAKYGVDEDGTMPSIAICPFREECAKRHGV